jgi:DNA-binding NtrC family response regulator
MKATILLVSDCPMIRDSLGHSLRLEGYNVTLASNGQEAHKTLRKRNCDLILLDLDIPAGSGWHTLRRMVRNSLSLPVILSLSLPVIIITGRSDQRFLTTQKGVGALYEKPLNLPRVLDGVKRALGRRPERAGKELNPGSSFPPRL